MAFVTSSQKMFKLDEDDKRIINLMIDEPELSFTQIAEKLQLPKTTVHNRFKKMEAEKIISRSVKVNRNTLYGDIIVFILIKIIGADQKEVLDRLMNLDEVEESAIVTGENDMILRLRLQTIQGLNNFILEKLRKIPGIANSTSMISLEYKNKLDDF